MADNPSLEDLGKISAETLLVLDEWQETGIVPDRVTLCIDFVKVQSDPAFPPINVEWTPIADNDYPGKIARFDFRDYSLDRWDHLFNILVTLNRDPNVRQISGLETCSSFLNY